MRYTAARTQRLGQQNDVSAADDHAANEALAWLRSRLRWERHLAELRTEDTLPHTTPNSRVTRPRPAVPAPEPATKSGAWWLRLLNAATGRAKVIPGSMRAD
jgi:hypothetical protein